MNQEAENNFLEGYEKKQRQIQRDIEGLQGALKTETNEDDKKWIETNIAILLADYNLRTQNLMMWVMLKKEPFTKLEYQDEVSCVEIAQEEGYNGA